MNVLGQLRTTAILGVTFLAVFALLPALECISAMAPSSESKKEADNVNTTDVALEAAKQRAASVLRNLPLRFEEAPGTQARISSFLARGRGIDIRISAGELLMHPRHVNQGASPQVQQASQAIRSLIPQPDATNCAAAPSQDSSLGIQLIGANRRATLTGENQLASRTNYLTGNDPRQWRCDVPNYAKVKAERIYNGVDVVYYSSEAQLEYDFNVAAEADYKSIRLRFTGAKRLDIDEAGDLIIDTPGGVVRQLRPVAYQFISHERHEIPIRYRLCGEREVRFELGAYDTHKPLIIDPVLAYSTIFGGTGEDLINGIALDSEGFVYATGTTDSINFPITSGALPLPDNIQSIESVGFVAKFDLTNNALIYSTYLGGSRSQFGGAALNECSAIAVDLTGSAYVTGKTNAVNFPVTSGAFQQALAGADDAFVAKLNPTGTGLVYSTYLGSSKSSDNPFPFVDDRGIDEGSSIAVDAAGSAYVTGRTTGNNFPVTSGALKTIHNNDVLPVGDIDPPIRAFGDVFITKLNAAGTALVYSTYLGGKGEDFSTGITVDSSGSAYVIGTTVARDFPVLNALQANLNSERDAFLSKLNPDGSSLIYSTYIGGSGNDWGNAVTLDGSGNVYITGTTTSTDLPATAGAFQPSSADVNLFESTNGGASWSAGNFGIPSDSSISHIVIDPANSSNLYASTSSLIFNSTDGGRTWKNTRTQVEGSSSLVPNKLITFDPKNPSIAYGVTESGFFPPSILKSLNGGRTWEAINTNFPFSPSLLTISFLAVDPVNTSTLFANTNQGLFKMTDGGPWLERDKGLFNDGNFVFFLTVDPRNDLRLFARAGGQGKFFVSTNGGKKWKPGSLGDTLVVGITFDPVTPSTAYASGDGLFKSTDSGDTWQEIENDLTDIGAIVVDPMNASVLYTVASTGVFKSVDGGHHWTAINTGFRPNGAFPANVISGLVIDPKNSSKLFATGFGGGTDTFMAKVNQSGSSFTYFTYLGGTGSDTAAGIAVDGAANLYVTGQTGSEDFPVKTALQPDKVFSTNDAFVAKLNATGSALVYSTYLGGSRLDVSSAIALDKVGNAYIAGYTFSFDFPLVPNLLPFRTTEAEGFLSKIADADSTLPAPLILEVGPRTGASTGQNTIIIIGANFLPGVRVRLGGVPVTVLDVNSGRITAIVNARPAGVVNVVVSNPDGQSAVLVNGYTYLAVPEIGSVEIEDKVLKVAGSNFDRGAIIFLNGIEQKTEQALYAPQGHNLLTSRKAAKRIAPGQQVIVRVRNANGLESEPFNYTRSTG